MISDLFPFIFDYGNVGHKMWCQVPLMPMVMKFVQLIRGRCVSSSVMLSRSGEKVKGQLWAEVTQIMVWGHMKVLPNMC